MKLASNLHDFHTKSRTSISKLLENINFKKQSQQKCEHKALNVSKPQQKNQPQITSTINTKLIKTKETDVAKHVKCKTK